MKNRHIIIGRRFPGVMMLALVLASLLGTAAKPERISADILIEAEQTELSKALHEAARQVVSDSIVRIKASLAETTRPSIERRAEAPRQRIAATRRQR